MEEYALTACMATMLVLAMICTIIFKKLKLPAIVGYLATGIILANYWGSYDGTNTEMIVSLLSNLGLALLMFSIGMELNFDKLRRNGAFAVLVVLVQVPIVIAAGVIFGSFLGWSMSLSICMGAILAGSSTAVVLVVQREKQVLDEENVNLLLLILVVEDVAQVVLMSILTPMLGSGNMEVMDIVFLMIKIVLFMAASVFIGVRFVPRILDWVGDKMSSEVLIVSALALCFLLSFLSVAIGMSMAVGAFLIGVIVSQSKHSGHIEHSIEPMKDIFMAMFFISIGLEVNPTDLMNNIPLMLGIFLLFLVSRTIAIYLGYFIGNRDPRLGYVSATSLLTMGEFAFILSAMAYNAGAMDAGVHAAVIGAALLTMVTQSFITGSAGKVYDKLTSVEPAFLRRFNGFLMRQRDRMYDAFGSMSKNTLDGFKKFAIFIYFSGFILVIVFAIFFHYGGYMAEKLDEMIAGINIYQSSLIVHLLEFVSLLVPISLMISNLYSLTKVFSDPAKKAWSLSESRELYLQRSLSINLWIPTVLLDFVLLLITPGRLGLLEHLLISVGGVAIFALLWIFKFRRSAHLFSGPEEEETGIKEE